MQYNASLDITKKNVVDKWYLVFSTSDEDCSISYFENYLKILTKINSKNITFSIFYSQPEEAKVNIFSSLSGKFEDRTVSLSKLLKFLGTF